MESVAMVSERVAMRKAFKFDAQSAAHFEAESLQRDLGRLLIL